MTDIILVRGAPKRGRAPNFGKGGFAPPQPLAPNIYTYLVIVGA
jgi:hypothetical protein